MIGVDFQTFRKANFLTLLDVIPGSCAFITAEKLPWAARNLARNHGPCPPSNIADAKLNFVAVGLRRKTT